MAFNKKLEYIKANYLHKKAKLIADELGISEQHVRQIVSYNGLSVGLRAKTEYTDVVNARFFDTITSESAYVLGFLYADGDIHNDRLSFTQKERDILDTIATTMKCKKPPVYYKPCYKLVIHCAYLCDRLRKIGVRQAKCKTEFAMVFPECLSDNVLPHFFRGFFDGDGSVGIYGKWGNCRLSLFGNEHFLSKLCERVHHSLNLSRESQKLRRASSKQPFFKVCSWGNKSDVAKIHAWMYADAKSLYLKRKKDIFERASFVDRRFLVS